MTSWRGDVEAGVSAWLGDETRPESHHEAGNRGPVRGDPVPDDLFPDRQQDRELGPEADRIEIHIDYRPRTFSLEVRDDGRGFTPADAEAARARGHLGITGIRERAAQLGGRCDFQPRPGGGTIVTLELPLE